MKVIKFPNKTTARIVDGKLQAPEGYHAKEVGDRMERIKRSLQKINELMKELRYD